MQPKGKFRATNHPTLATAPLEHRDCPQEKLWDSVLAWNPEFFIVDVTPLFATASHSCFTEDVLQLSEQQPLLPVWLSRESKHQCRVTLLYTCPMDIPS